MTRGGRQAICAAVAMLLWKDTMDTGLTLEDLRQIRRASHSARLQVYTRLDRSVRRPVDLAALMGAAAQVLAWAGSRRPSSTPRDALS